MASVATTRARAKLNAERKFGRIDAIASIKTSTQRKKTLSWLHLIHVRLLCSLNDPSTPPPTPQIREPYPLSLSLAHKHPAKKHVTDLDERNLDLDFSVKDRLCFFPHAARRQGPVSNYEPACQVVLSHFQPPADLTRPQPILRPENESNPCMEKKRAADVDDDTCRVWRSGCEIGGSSGMIFIFVVRIRVGR